MAGRVALSLPLALVALLLVATLAGVPPAGAQEAEGNLVVEDPAGDQGPFFIGPGNPAPESMGMSDIIRVEVGNEDADSYEIIVDVVGAEGPVGTAGRAVALTDFNCNVRFGHGSEVTSGPSDPLGYYYQVRFISTVTDLPQETPSQPEHTARFYGWGPERSNSASINSGVGVTYEPDASLFRIHVQKAFTPVFPGARNAGTGDHLYLLNVSCSTDTLAYFNWSDNVDVQDERYAFTGPRSDGVVSIAFVTPQGEAVGGTNAWDWTPPDAGQGAPQSSVAPDATTVLPVMLTNNAASRKLVALSVGSPDELAAGWNITIAESVFLAAGENRTVNLIVTPPPNAAAGAQARIEVVAKLAGEESTTVAPRTLQVIPVFGGSADTIYLHTRGVDSFGLFGPAQDTLFPPFEYGASLLRDDAEWTDVETVLSPLFGSGNTEALDPLVRPVMIDPDLPVQGTVVFSGDAEEMVRVRATLYSEVLGTVFAIDESVPGDGTHILETYVQDAGAYLPAGTQLWFEFSVSRVQLDAGTASEVRFDPTGSHIVVPAEVYHDAELTLTDGTYLPTLALSEDEDRTAYLNPGKVYAYELVLANDGLETDDLVLSVNATNATGWQIDIEPGHRYRVTPGNSTPVGIVVRAPSAIEEGHKAEFAVTARSTHDDGAYSRLRLQAIVTTGVQIDEKPYAAGENQIAPLQEAKGSPGPAVLALVAALAAALRLARRCAPL